MTISVIIPTLNEADSITHLIRYIFKYGGDDIRDIIVVDGGSSDCTGEKAANAGALVIATSLACRASQMNLGVLKSEGDILYFVHADVQLIPSFARDILQSVKQGYAAGCFRFLFDSKKPMLRINSYCTRFKGIMCRGGDQSLFITRSLFQELRGFDEYYTIMEDYNLIERIRSKTPFRIIPKSIRVSARKYENNSWLRVQLSNLTVFLMYFMKRTPDEMRRVYQRLLDYR